MKQIKTSEKYPKYKFCSSGVIYSHYGKKMNPAKDHKGYLRTMLVDCNGVSKTIKVHRVIAMLFIPNPENKPQVNHINGIKHDNRIENLEWVTAKENAIHAVQNGLCKYTRLNKEKVIEIRKLYSEGVYNQREIGEKYGVDRRHVSDIVNFKRWNHI